MVVGSRDAVNCKTKIVIAPPRLSKLPKEKEEVHRHPETGKAMRRIKNPGEVPNSLPHLLRTRTELPPGLEAIPRPLPRSSAVLRVFQIRIFDPCQDDVAGDEDHTGKVNLGA